MEWNEENEVQPEQPVEETEETQPVFEPEPEPDAVEPEPEKASLLKKELSFRRKPKAPKEPKAASEPKAKQEKAPKEPKQKGAGLKKEISLPFGRKKAEKVPVEASSEPQAKAPRTLRAKREKSSSSKRSKKLVGLKIGGSQLAAARIVNNGSPELVQVARDRLERGIVVGGELREPELLAEALRVFFRKHKLPRQGVRLGIANNRIGVRIFEIAGISDAKQLENAIR